MNADKARDIAHKVMYGTVYVGSRLPRPLKSDYVVPLTLVTMYRLIPDKKRGEMFPDSPSTSLRAVLGLHLGLGWAAVLAAVSDSDVH